MSEQARYLTPSEIEQLKQRHAELTAKYLETEDEETLDKIADLEWLYYVGKPVATCTDEPFSD